MLKKIISGGLPGVERAALDVVIMLHIPYSGWVPKGKNTADEVLFTKYQLQEMPITGTSKQVERNVTGSDGSLILARGRLTGLLDLTHRVALKHKHPALHVDPNKKSLFQAALTLSNWISQNNIEALHVSGTQTPVDPKIYAETKKMLEAVHKIEQDGDRIYGTDPVD